MDRNGFARFTVGKLTRGLVYNAKLHAALKLVQVLQRDIFTNPMPFQVCQFSAVFQSACISRAVCVAEHFGFFHVS